MNLDPWNKCDGCGRFIAYYDFVEGIAKVYYIEPSSEFGDEVIEKLCGNCRGE